MAKGSNFEREISKQLSLWFTNGKTELGFYRTAGSGGRATSRRRGNKETNKEDFGDIKADLEECKPLTDLFVIELKTGYATKSKSKAKKHNGAEVVKVNNWAIMDEIDSKQEETQFMKFWKQVCRDAAISNKEPWLIFRRQNKMTCIAMYSDVFEYIREKFQKTHLTRMELYPEHFSQITICNLNDFLNMTKEGFNKEFLISMKEDLFGGET
jgi:hypothetical protein